ncbi:hypothetical protein [Psychromonas arctica]|uniref:hypothetical protein n=1 Tax=Psychromonas arctica TaxID=168275 RepID=UPI0003F8819A|nr:hypothetical protein [Psychromonas arctica]
MDINGSINLHSQPITILRNTPETSDLKYLAVETQKQTQSVDEVTTQQPILQAQAPSEDVISSRVSEYQSLTANNQLQDDKSIGSLLDIKI